MFRFIRNAALLRAATDGNLDKIKQVLEKGVNVNATDVDGYTPLTNAIRAGHQEIARLLLEHEADPNTKVKNGETALIMSAFRGQIDIVRLLVEKGADLELADEKGQTALIAACEGKKREVVEALLNAGARPDAVDCKQRTAFTVAVNKLDTATVTLLLEKGIDSNQEVESGKPALLIAADRDDIQLAEAVVNHGANLEAKDKDGKTALMIAAQRGCLPIVRLLQDAGADSGTTDSEGQTAFSAAVKNGREEVVRALLDQGADPNQEVEADKVALLWAVENGQTGLVALLLGSGADVKRADTQTSKSLFEVAVSRGHLDLARLLRPDKTEQQTPQRDAETILIPTLQSVKEYVQGLLKDIRSRGKVDTLFLMGLMIGISRILNEDVAKRFNAVLKEARRLFPGAESLQRFDEFKPGLPETFDPSHWQLFAAKLEAAEGETVRLIQELSQAASGGDKNAPETSSSRTRFVLSGGITIEGGPGDAIERPLIVRGAPNDTRGISAEYEYLARTLGDGYTAKLAEPHFEAQGCLFDRVRVDFADGRHQDFFFDITESFGKGR